MSINKINVAGEDRRRTLTVSLMARPVGQSVRLSHKLFIIIYKVPAIFRVSFLMIPGDFVFQFP
jgi:hypothetical protein